MSAALGKLGLLVAFTCLALVVLEVSLRAAGYDPTMLMGPVGRELILRPSTDPRTRYELTPGSTGQAWGTDVRVNAVGLRGPELLPRLPDRARVIVLGDSIAFGSLVAEDRAVSADLARLLQARHRSAEILNLGVGGYDTLQEAARLETFGLPLDPDVVVLVYCLNDVGIVSANLEYIEGLEAQRSGMLGRLALTQFVHSRLARPMHTDWMEEVNKPVNFRRTFAGQIHDVGGDGPLRDLMAAASEVPPSHWYREPDRIGRLRFAFRSLAELLGRERIPLVVAIVPWLEEGETDYAYRVAHRIVDHEARRAGFFVVDLLDAFSAEGLETLRKNSGDPTHPNERGHLLVARGVVDWVSARLQEASRR